MKDFSQTNFAIPHMVKRLVIQFHHFKVAHGIILSKSASKSLWSSGALWLQTFIGFCHVGELTGDNPSVYFCLHLMLRPPEYFMEVKPNVNTTTGFPESWSLCRMKQLCPFSLCCTQTLTKWFQTQKKQSHRAKCWAGENHLSDKNAASQCNSWKAVCSLVWCPIETRLVFISVLIISVFSCVCKCNVLLCLVEVFQAVSHSVHSSFAEDVFILSPGLFHFLSSVQTSLFIG